MSYLQITLRIASENRGAAADVDQKHKAPFLETIAGAQSKNLLARNEDVQILHGFDTARTPGGTSKASCSPTTWWPD